MLLTTLTILTVSCMSQKVIANANDCDVDSFPVQTHFTIERFLGKWYEVKWYADHYHNLAVSKPSYDDFTLVYTKQSDGNISVVSTRRDPNTKGCDYYHSTLYLTDTPAKFKMDKKDQGTLSDYWIIKTDYTNFAVVYICHGENSDGTCGNAKSWVYSRHPHLAVDLMAETDHQLEQLCMNAVQLNQAPWSDSCDPCFARNKSIYLRGFIRV